MVWKVFGCCRSPSKLDVPAPSSSKFQPSVVESGEVFNSFTLNVPICSHESAISRWNFHFAFICIQFEPNSEIQSLQIQFAN